MNSKHKSDYGEWKLTSGNFYGDGDKDKGKCFEFPIHLLQNNNHVLCLRKTEILLMLYSL